MRLVILNMLTSLLFQQVIAQSSIENALKQIETNNKSLHSNSRYWEARRAEFGTGLTPYDPQVEYDYLPGSPADAGIQKDFSVTQRLDFPTAYKRKRSLAKEQVAQTRLQQSAYRQDVLLEAKLLINEIIYLNKRSAEFDRRLAQMELLNRDYQKKLDRGDVIILDVNKVKLQLYNVKAEQAL